MRPILGWRKWNGFFEWTTRQGRIELTRGKQTFPFDGPAVATCEPSVYDWKDVYAPPGAKKALEEPHVSPDPRCTCGIYAFHDTGARGKYPFTYDQYCSVYLVKCWGRVGYGEQSQLRAQYVEPVAISFRLEWNYERVAEAADRLARNYDIPIIYHHQIPLFAELTGLSFERPEEVPA